MISAFIHKTLPEGALKVKKEAQFYRLKKRKKVMYESNKELHVGMRYLIWSRFARVWYERVVDEGTLEDNINWYTMCGWLWLYPTETNKNEIREDVEKHKIGYWALMEKRQTEIDHENHLRYANKGDGFRYKDMDYRRRRYKK